MTTKYITEDIDLLTEKVHGQVKPNQMKFENKYKNKYNKGIRNICSIAEINTQYMDSVVYQKLILTTWMV